MTIEKNTRRGSVRLTNVELGKLSGDIVRVRLKPYLGAVIVIGGP